MIRQHAIAVDGMWAGLVRTRPRTATRWHHHGAYETSIYVASGRIVMESDPAGGAFIEAGPGDFLHVPPGAIQREANPDPEERQIVVVRAGHSPAVINVDGQPQADSCPPAYHPHMNFCPRCGTALIPRLDGGRHRPACPNEGCGFTHYGDHSIGTGAVVFRDDRILLIERRVRERRFWQIPGGHVEVDEPIDSAIEREVLEETGVTARVLDCLGFRHAAGVNAERPASNIYVVFRLEDTGGDPRPDGEESFDARFFTRAEVADLADVTSTSLWAIDQTAPVETGHGFLRLAHRDGLHRPGHTIFGLT